MAIKEKLTRLVKDLACPSKNVRAKLDAAYAMLKEKDTNIPDDEAGKQSVYRFLFLLFSTYPETMTLKNYKKLEELVNELDNPAPRKGKGQRY